MPGRARQAPAGVIPLPVTSPTTSRTMAESRARVRCGSLPRRSRSTTRWLTARPLRSMAVTPSRSTATSAPIPTIVPLAGASGTPGRPAPTAARGASSVTMWPRTRDSTRSETVPRVRPVAWAIWARVTGAFGSRMCERTRARLCSRTSCCRAGSVRQGPLVPPLRVRAAGARFGVAALVMSRHDSPPAQICSEGVPIPGRRPRAGGASRSARYPVRVAHPLTERP